MKLLFNGVDLAQLGTLRILGHNTVREPAEAPQWERVTWRMRLDFFEQTYQDNASLMDQLRGALRAGTAQLLWQDDSGATYLQRTVTASEDAAVEEAGSKGGTFWQGVTFTFWYLNYDNAMGALGATYQRSGGVLQSLGAVEKWEEGLNITRWDEMRSAVKKVEGQGRASGRLKGDTTTPLGQRQQSLMALKDQLTAELSSGSDGTLKFGTFNRVVRVANFQAQVDQPNNYITWSFSWTYTAYPNESDYIWLDLKLVQRQSKAEGICRFTLSGRMGAVSRDKGRARLTVLKSSLAPSGYILQTEEVTEPRQRVESSGASRDGDVFTELQFSYEYRETNGKTCTYQGAGANRQAIDLGTVDKFRDGYQSSLFDEMRSNRKRVGGHVAIGGAWYVPEGTDSAQTEAILSARKAQWDAEMVNGSSGTLQYGLQNGTQTPLFNQVVRILDWNADINRLKNRIEWSLTASFTHYPNESDYALCEFRLSTRQDRQEGTVVMSLTGKIGAPSPDLARAKLARLRSSLIPGGFVLKTDSGEESRVDVESGLQGGNDVGDGAAFIELAINEEWQKASGAILAYTLRHTDDDDTKTGWVHSTYAGTVQASAADQASAFTAAKAQAAALGDGKYAFKLRSSVTENSRQVLTDGQVIVSVEFSYEYQQKGTRIYTEVVSELTTEAFGQNVEAVSGMIAAPSLALAQATYQSEVRNLSIYNGALVLNERKPTLAEQRVKNQDGSGATTLFDRFVFSFQVLRAKTSSQRSISYTVTTATNVLALEVMRSANGTVYAESEAAANAFLDAMLPAIGLTGSRVESTRQARYQSANDVSVAAQSTFISLEFNERWVGVLTGIDGIVECDCDEEVAYAANRLVQKPVPGGATIVQGADGSLGLTCGHRKVSARARALTETTALAWVKVIRTGLLSGQGLEEPPVIRTGFSFLPLTSGVPRGDGANVKVYEVTGTFSELLPEQIFQG